MTIAEKITNSRDKALFTLYKEGVFYRCYNEDAMLFAQRVRAYKVNCKYVKSVGAEVLSLGFPVSEVGKGNVSFEFILEAIAAECYNEEPHGIVFSLKDDIKLNYNKFQEAIITPKTPFAEKESDNDNSNIQKLVKMIREFDLANHTPMQGLSFIQELKNHIKTQG